MAERLLKDLFRSVLQYAATVLGGTVLFVFLAQCIGYLGYSDRPGPGWYGWFPLKSFSQFWDVVGFLLGWFEISVPTTFIVGTVLFIFVRSLELGKFPRLLVVLLGSLASGYVSQDMIAGLGWYIALGWVPVMVAGLLGLFYGGCLLPRRPASPRSIEVHPHHPQASTQSGTGR